MIIDKNQNEKKVKENNDIQRLIINEWKHISVQRIAHMSCKTIKSEYHENKFQVMTKLHQTGSV